MLLKYAEKKEKTEKGINKGELEIRRYNAACDSIVVQKNILD